MKIKVNIFKNIGAAVLWFTLQFVRDFVETFYFNFFVPRVQYGEFKS